MFSLDELVVDNYVISVGGAAGTWTETMQLVVPDDGTLGEHIMRAKTNWNASVPDDACEETQYGETEDYMVNIVESLGFSNIQIDNISVYPNPVSNLLNVNTGTNNDLSYSIFNIMGQSISNGKLTTIDNRIDFSQLSKGVYFFNIYNRELNKQNTYKLIKE